MSDEVLDFNHVATLLMVAEKTLGFPKLKKIHDAAVAELEAMIAEPVEEVEAVEEEPAEEEADA